MPVYYSLRHLAYLAAVADHQSFSRAAAACNVTQSTLSLGIKELERQVGVPLLERGRKIALPTAAGREILAHARDILARNAALGEATERLNDPQGGPLRIGIIPTIAPFLLPRVLPAFEAGFPGTSIRITEATTDVILSNVREGHIDIGVLALPVPVGDLESRSLFTDPFLLAVHKDKGMTEPADIGRAGPESLLLLRDGHCMKDHALSACNLPPNRQNRFFEAESIHTLLAMVNQGYGMTLVPSMAVATGCQTAYPNVRILTIGDPAPARQVGMVWRRGDGRAGRYLTVDFAP